MSVLVFQFVKQDFCGSINFLMNAIKQIDVSFSFVPPVIDHEPRQSIAKVAVDHWVDLDTTLIMLWGNALSITGKTHEKLASVFLGQPNCQIVRSRSLTHRIYKKNHVSVLSLKIKISQWVRENFCSYCKNILYTDAKKIVRNGSPEKCDNTHKPSPCIHT